MLEPRSSSEGRGSGLSAYLSTALTLGVILRRCLVLAAVAALLAACSGSSAGTYELPSEQATEYATAYIAVVVADPDGDDMEPGAGEHVVLRNNWDHRTDMGGWSTEDAGGNRLRLGTGRQLDPDTELRVHPSCGEDSEEAVFACLETEVLDDDGDVLRLLDSADGEVARFAYGTAA